MSEPTGLSRHLSLREAFEAEHARRDAERRAKEDAERLQQEADLARAEQLYEALAADRDFLHGKGLTLHHRRYTVSLEHVDYRIASYFEEGQATVTLADKRTHTGGLAPLKSEVAQSVDEALMTMARFLADETH